MPVRIAVTTLNASTADIINTIRANASAEYQSLVPEVTQSNDVPKVGEIVCGYPRLANEYLTSLVNRIAAVKIKSAVFNNAYKELKKGYLEFGDTVVEYFVKIAKAREFSAEKAEQREFKRTIPDVASAFHIMNYRVQYPLTIQDRDLRQAFTSFQGMEDFIAKLVDSIYTAAEYDEFLLFKYLIIKAVSHGKMRAIGVDGSDIKNYAVKFRGTSNSLTFMSDKNNAAGVHTTTPKRDQFIFMDADFNAQFDVNVLASAFNMDKAEFMGKLKLIDNFTTFDNDRFDVIRAGSDQIDEVTADELALMANVKAILVDGEWFQVYDNLAAFTETYVSSGMYWNYFYNIWKTVSSSPFSNAVVFVDDSATITDLASITFTVSDKSVDDTNTVISLVPSDTATLQNTNYTFVQTESATENGIAVHRYGAFIIPNTEADGTVPQLKIGNAVYNGTAITPESDVGDTITFTKV
jgi:hypothetical protein